MQTSTSSHSCTICNIEFELRFELRTHMTTVHEPKPAKVPQPAVNKDVVKQEAAAKVVKQEQKPKVQPVKIVNKKARTEATPQRSPAPPARPAATARPAAPPSRPAPPTRPAAPPARPAAPALAPAPPARTPAPPVRTARPAAPARAPAPPAPARQAPPARQAVPTRPVAHPARPAAPVRPVAPSQAQPSARAPAPARTQAPRGSPAPSPAPSPGPAPCPPVRKFDEAMIEDYNEDELVEEELEEEAMPVKQEVKQELWGGAWYASSATLAARFELQDVAMQLGRQAFPRQAEWLAYVCPHLRAANPQARRAHLFMLAKAKWFEADGAAAARLGRGARVVVNM